MRLPIPVVVDGNIYNEAKIKRATSIVIANTTDAAESGDTYTAILEWCTGITQELSGDNGVIDNTSDIRRAIRSMPFQSAFLLACYGMAETKKDDSISGIYVCPECGNKIRLEKINIDGEIIDDTDHLFSLDIPCIDDPTGGISVSLEYPVEIKKRNTNEVIEKIETILMDWPTLGQCIKAHQQHPDSDMHMQFSLYADSIKSVNGIARNFAWKTSFGITLFEKMDSDDLMAISDKIQENSINVKKERICMKCHAHWDAPIDLSSFFASGLKKKAR